jgi:hypothetical protein
VGKGAATLGDELRFGDLRFRVEGLAPSGTRWVEGGAPRNQMAILMVGGGLCALVFLLVILMLAKKPRPVRLSARVGLQRLSVQVDQHLRAGRALLEEHKYDQAATELDAALVRDPANLEAIKLRAQAQRAPDDERHVKAAIGALNAGDRRGFEGGLRALAEITQGSPAEQQLKQSLIRNLEQFGPARCKQKGYEDCAWALCRSAELRGADSPLDPGNQRLLRDAETKLSKKDRMFVRCRAN